MEHGKHAKDMPMKKHAKGMPPKEMPRKGGKKGK